MARFIRCPRCQNTLDVTNAAGGSTVRCSKCSALVRVPTGQTGPVPAQKPQTKPATRSGKKGTSVVRRGRSTPLFRKMQTAGGPAMTPGSRGPSRDTRVRKKAGMHPGIIAGIGIGAVVLVVVVILVATSGKTPPPAPPQQVDDPALVAGNRTAITGTAENLSNPDATPIGKAAEPKEKETKQPSMVRTASGAYDVPAEFEPGATGQTSAKTGLSQEDMDVSGALLEEVTGKLRTGATADLQKDEVKYIGAVICCMISDDKDVAYNAFKYLHDFCERRKISSSEERYDNPVNLEYFNSAYWRGGEWAYWSAEWYPKNKLRIVNPGDEGKVHVSGNAKTADWEKLMAKLRAGGAYDDLERPEGLAFATVKSMGREAYPYLVKYIDHEDPMLGRAAVTVLNQLTGRDTRYTPAQKETCKRDWEAWVEKN